MEMLTQMRTLDDDLATLRAVNKNLKSAAGSLPPRTTTLLGDQAT
jgi:hypothetical protein